MISNNQDLKAYNTFGISVSASHFASFSTIEELKYAIRQFSNEELLILGGGSNVLFTKDFNGLVLRNEIKGFEIVDRTVDSVIVKAGAGEVWHEFVLKCIDEGFAGLENLSLIPGSVGASPMQNIGAYGVEIKDVFHSLEAYHLSSGEIHTFDAKSCEFGYRESVFKRKLKGQYVILSVSFKLSNNPNLNTSYGAIESELKNMGIEHPTIKDISNAVIAIRSSKLPNPKEIGNAGSFFKNPVVEESVVAEILKTYPDAPNYPAEQGKRKLAAGWLIEQAGWKGKTIENHGVHKLQALVLVNYGGATGQQIWDLSSAIIASIEAKFGVTLEREVNIL
ncbi:MAG: UDP-N-acetylmuramate dehydrogenase [Crocinitomicaceae bacterium]|nr:UDP-N-acetylmuramate dehydrogenase [Crocinitomicaceae bacterium]